MDPQTLELHKKDFANVCIMLAFVWLFNIVRAYFLFDFKHFKKFDMCYFFGIILEAIIFTSACLYQLSVKEPDHSFFWMYAGFVAGRLFILEIIYIWIQCTSKTYTYLHEEEDIENILEHFDDDEKNEDDKNLKIPPMENVLPVLNKWRFLQDFLLYNIQSENYSFNVYNTNIFEFFHTTIFIQDGFDLLDFQKLD